MENEITRRGGDAMTTLSEAMELATSRGYTEEFRMDSNGLCAVNREGHFEPRQIHIPNFYRFEGASNPDDTAVLYLLETDSGLKGTLVDAYGVYSDVRINEFVRQVEDFHKGTAG